MGCWGRHWGLRGGRNRRVEKNEYWGTLQSVLYSRYCWSDQSKELRCGAKGTYGAGEKCRKDFVRNPEGGKPPGRPRHKWENKGKMDCKEVGWETVDLINLAKGRDMWWAVAYKVVHFKVPYIVQNDFINWGSCRVSRRPLIHGASFSSKWSAVLTINLTFRRLTSTIVDVAPLTSKIAFYIFIQQI